MEVRLFRNSDAQQVVDLWEQCGLLRPWNDPLMDIERKVRVGDELFLVGEEGGTVVATAMGGYDGHRGWVYYLAVKPDARSHGLGRKIMEDLEQRLLAIGCPKIDLMVRDSNDQAIGFYKAIGYSVDPVVVLSKRLIPDEK